MEIAINGRFLLPGRLEGMGYYTLQLVMSLSEAFPEIHFSVLLDREVEVHWTERNNVSYVVLQPQARHPVLFYLWFQFAVKRYLKRSKTDLFISPDGFCTLGASCPTVLTVHDIAYKRYPEHLTPIMRKYYDFFVPRFIDEAKHIVTVSNFSRDEVIQFFPSSEAKISVSCNGVRQCFMEGSLETGDKHDYFVVLGAIHPRKNLLHVVHSFLNYKDQTKAPTQLKIVGRKGWKYKDVFGLVNASRFKEDILFTGYLRDEQLVAEIRNATALIYVSLYEGFGVPIIEAMSLEVPVITSDHGSMKEVAGDAAILVDPRDKEELVRAMIEISSNDVLRTEMIERGKKRLQKYSWTKAMQPYVDIIRSHRV